MLIDDEPPRKKEGPEPRKLEPLAIAELQEYVTWLNGEITRTQDEIKRKKASAAAAASFFKS